MNWGRCEDVLHAGQGGETGWGGGGRMERGKEKMKVKSWMIREL